MPRDERFVYMGVRASEIEEEQMQNPPACDPKDLPGGFTLPSQAQVMHGVALANGLPDIHGFYGYDFEEHSFIKLPQSTVKRVVAPKEPEPVDMGPLTEDEDEEFRELQDAELDAALREGFEE